MTEREKMINGMMYDAYDPELCAMRERCRLLQDRLNRTDSSRAEERAELLRELLGGCGKNVYLLDGKFDYGCNTYLGDEFSANFNFVCLDCAPVRIGHHVLIGPNVTIATPVHPLLAEERNFYYDANGGRHLYEYAKPITIGDNVWIASNVTVCGGVTIGEGCVIGAGSVVTKDIPAGTVAVGAPCRPIRKITEKDSVHGIPGLY